MTETGGYLMENRDEIIRLEGKTDPGAFYRQAAWCGVRPGMRVLDAGCGPGLTTSFLREMVMPGDPPRVSIFPRQELNTREKPMGIFREFASNSVIFANPSRNSEPSISSGFVSSSSTSEKRLFES
mgnify:CR=1 FL=1